MPFDSLNYEKSPPALRIMDAVIERLHLPGSWCKSTLEDAEGRVCMLGALQGVRGLPNDDDACILLSKADDILAAIAAAIGFTRDEARDLYCQRLSVVSHYNDRSDTTHADVMAVLRRAREILVKETV